MGVERKIECQFSFKSAMHGGFMISINCTKTYNLADDLSRNLVSIWIPFALFTLKIEYEIRRFEIFFLEVSG